VLTTRIVVTRRLRPEVQSMAADPKYQPMTLADLARHLRDADNDETRWRLVWEFFEEYRWEASPGRLRLLKDDPESVGDERWDTLLAALAEHLAAQDESAAPRWTEERFLQRWWFPFDLPSQHVEALVHAPMAFRRRGVFVSARNLEAA
jgi:hypothetical protein